MVWVNIDRVFKTCTIHMERCRYVSYYVKGEGKPQFKGIEELKRDGGWFSRNSIGEARDFCKRDWEPKGYNIKRGCSCLRGLVTLYP